MSDITERAEALAKAHPVGEVLENAFFGSFKLAGMAAGGAFRAVNWALFHAYTLIFIIWLAFKDGFKQTAKIQPKPAAAVEQPPIVQKLLDDPRYHDQNTPFGVPYGPNVHASHE